jgi:hypothetical protein
MIVLVQFAKASGTKPDARQLYDEAIKYNPSWKSEIDSIIRLAISHPTLGTEEFDLSEVPSDEDRKEIEKRNFESLTKDKEYLKAKARSAKILINDENPSTPQADKDRSRLVYSVVDITSKARLSRMLEYNEKASLFKVSIPPTVLQFKNGTKYKSGEHKFLVISEIGGHYTWKNTPIRKNTSSDLDFLDEAFSIDNLK